jgi:dTDP-D-glucose 4,6-dehydratase
MLNSETVKQDLDRLTNEQLQQVADFIAFLKYRSNRDRRFILDPSQLAALTEFAQEDRALAEAGINDYAAMLRQEDESYCPRVFDKDEISDETKQRSSVLETITNLRSQQPSFKTPEDVDIEILEEKSTWSK